MDHSWYAIPHCKKWGVEVTPPTTFNTRCDNSSGCIHNTPCSVSTFGVNPTPLEKGGVIATPLLHTYRKNVQKQYVVILGFTEKYCSGHMLMFRVYVLWFRGVVQRLDKGTYFSLSKFCEVSMLFTHCSGVLAQSNQLFLPQ